MTLHARVARYRLPLGSAVRTARATWQERSGVIFTLEDGQGGFGQGEAAPLPSYSHDSLAEAESLLSRLDLDWLSSLLARAEERPNTLLPALAEGPSNRVPSAHFALETATLDLLARRRKEPLHGLLRAAFPEASGAPASLALTALLSPESPLESAERALRAGFSSLKLKVGLPGREHEEAIELTALRARLGPDVRLRLDANGAWSAEVAAARLATFAELGIEFIEEPTAPSEAPLLNPALPVALDESLRRAALPTRAEMSARGIVALVIKPSVLGGFLSSFELSARARELGCASVLSHGFEGPVAFAALCELALALGRSRFSQGLGPHRALAAWPEKPAASLGRAELVPHDEPGLGLGPAPVEPAGAS